MFGTAAAHFPYGKHYALTWSIPDDYGGMTNALIRRSNMFHNLGGVEVEILTIDDRPDYAEVTSRLRNAGRLAPGVRIRNLWDDLRDRALTESTVAPIAVEQMSAAEHDRLTQCDGVILLRERRDDQGNLIGADRFRRDGTLLATERVQQNAGRVQQSAGRQARSIVLYDAEGAPVRGFRSRWGLYRWWLDRVFGKKLSFLLVDSKTSARFIPDYRRENVVTVHIVHASHRAQSRSQELRHSRKATLQRIDDFDAVVVLSERQRRELQEDLSAIGIEPCDRIRVVPNGVDLPPADHCDHRRGEGIVVASLDDRKRVDRAVDAVTEAHTRARNVSLNVYGDGKRATELETRVAVQGASNFIALHGHVARASTHFQRADFSLLTSTSEGFPLVLIESMAAGCIPIACDIRYGPADIIRDGIDGYLVPDGDTDALADCIVRLQNLSPTRLKSMRRGAMRRSREFSDLAVARRWARELQSVLDAKRIRDAADDPLRIRLRRGAGVVRRRARRLVGY